MVSFGVLLDLGRFCLQHLFALLVVFTHYRYTCMRYKNTSRAWLLIAVAALPILVSSNCHGQSAPHTAPAAQRLTRPIVHAAPAAQRLKIGQERQRTTQ